MYEDFKLAFAKLYELVNQLIYGDFALRANTCQTSPTLRFSIAFPLHIWSGDFKLLFQNCMNLSIDLNLIFQNIMNCQSDDMYGDSNILIVGMGNTGFFLIISVANRRTVAMGNVGFFFCKRGLIFGKSGNK